VDEKISPEERLFKVIQERKKSDDPASPPGRFEIPVRQDKPLFNPFKKWKQLLVHFIRKFKPVSPGKEPAAAEPAVLPMALQSLDLKLVTKVLMGVLAFLILWTALEIFQRPGLLKVTGGVLEEGYQIGSTKPVDIFKPLAFYVQQAKSRDLFQPVVSAKRGKSGGPVASGITKDLALAGIYQGEGQNFEAIIEDKSIQKTYFLKIGDQINGMTIKAILKDRVILQYGKEEMELL